MTGHAALLDCRPELQQAVELRNPYVDALSFLQLRFLDGRGRAERLVQATVNGVAAGLRNTGAGGRGCAQHGIAAGLRNTR